VNWAPGHAEIAVSVVSADKGRQCWCWTL